MWHLFWFCRHVAVQDVHRAAVGNLLVTSCPCPRFESWATASWEQLWEIVQGVLHARDTTWFLPFLQRLGFFVQNAILREQSNTATLAHIVHDWKILEVHSNKVDSTSFSQRCKLLLVVASSINVWVLSFLEDMSKCIIWYAAQKAVNVPWVGDRLPAVHRRPSSRHNWKNLAVTQQQNNESKQKNIKLSMTVAFEEAAKHKENDGKCQARWLSNRVVQTLLR